MNNFNAAINHLETTHANMVTYFQDILDGRKPDLDEYLEIIGNVQEAQEKLPVSALVSYYYNQQTRALKHRPTTNELERSWQQFNALQDRLFGVTSLPRKMVVVHQEMLKVAAGYELGGF